MDDSWRVFWTGTLVFLALYGFYVVKHESLHAQIGGYYGCENITFGISTEKDITFLSPYTQRDCLISEERYLQLTYWDSLNEVLSSIIMLLLLTGYCYYVLK